MATHASRGQQRTIILALKLAETELLGVDGPRPIVLLDDVFSELDPERSERALALLLERGQVLVTMADLAVIPAPATRRAGLARRRGELRLPRVRMSQRAEEAAGAVSARCWPAWARAPPSSSRAQARLAWHEAVVEAGWRAAG